MVEKSFIQNVIGFIPIEQMYKRAIDSKEESDSSYFYDLIALGEMVTKITAVFLVENIEDDVDRTRYRFEYQLVRADGVGEFAQVINSITTGSTADYLPDTVCSTEIVELNSKIADDSWQKEALENLKDVLMALDIHVNSYTKKSSLRIWFSNFSELRNKTKGHGSPTAAQCGRVIAPLEQSIRIIYENLSLFKRNWAYLRQNMNGKYRVSEFGGYSGVFDYLKRSKDHKYQEGVYVFTDKPHRVDLMVSDEELTKFLLVNGKKIFFPLK